MPKGDLVTAAMIVGWAVGGLFFGIMGDKWGRVRTLSTSILVYSLFTGLSGLSVTWYDFCAWRFLMGCGIGGAFATAATLIAETMPTRYRALALGSFQALSATGNMIGSLVATYAIKPGLPFAGTSIPGWRALFFFGILPAFLIFLIMRTIREPEAWIRARKTARDSLDRQMGDLSSMWRHPRWRRNVVVGVVLSVAGVVGLWGVGFWSPELISEALRSASDEEKNYHRGMVMFVQEIGALLGMFSFTFLALWLGRRVTFALCFTLAFVVVSLVFTRLHSVEQAYWMMPLVGFATLSVFGGYAIYFPELFPTRLRATGTGICYNVGRIVSAGVLLAKIPLRNLFESPALKAQADAIPASQAAAESFFGLLTRSPFRTVMVAVCAVYLLGILAVFWAPETKGKPLPTDDDAEG
jgi:predicted MFS family arabinose efflux permease